MSAVQYNISEIIESIKPISKSSITLIESQTRSIIHAKGTIFSAARSIDQFEYFVLDGVCRSFLLNQEGLPTTISFFMGGSIISPYVSRTEEGRSLVNLEALTDLKLGVIKAVDFEQMMVENLEIREFGNQVLRNELKAKVAKEISLATRPSSERLQEMRRNFPSLENLVPHHTIATYLGITAISLSRLRKDLMA